MKKTLKLNKGPYMKKFIITCIFLILQSENALAQDANQDTYNRHSAPLISVSGIKSEISFSH